MSEEEASPVDPRLACTVPSSGARWRWSAFAARQWLDARPSISDENCRIDVWVSDARMELHLSGDFDLASVEYTAQVLAPLNLLRATVVLDFAAVRFIDSTGIEPFVELDRLRYAGGQSRVAITAAASRCAARFLDLSGLGGTPDFDLDAWDHLVVPPPGPTLELDAAASRVLPTRAAVLHEHRAVASHGPPSPGPTSFIHLEQGRITEPPDRRASTYRSGIPRGECEH
jgi:anti-anti-sigma factor